MPVYTIVFRQRALKEYFEATAWYKEHSLQAAENFVNVINSTAQSISEHPYAYKNSYKHFYEAKTKRFPFSIIYFIDDIEQQVVITTVFHQKRNPKQKFR